MSSQPNKLYYWTLTAQAQRNICDMAIQAATEHMKWKEEEDALMWEEEREERNLDDRWRLYKRCKLREQRDFRKYMRRNWKVSQVSPDSLRKPQLEEIKPESQYVLSEAP